MKKDKKNEGVQKNPFKLRKMLVTRFDWQGLWLVWGIGVVCSGVGWLIYYAVSTNESGPSTSSGYTVAQRLAHTLPYSLQEKLALVMAALMALFGLLCVYLGFKIIVQFVVLKRKLKQEQP